METLNSKKQVEVLNDLAQVNKDRIAGYERALNELHNNENEDLMQLFKHMINTSVDNNEALEKLIELYNGNLSEGTSGVGKIYRAWMDVKALFAGGDRKIILSSCETVEEMTLHSYSAVLAEEDLSRGVQELVNTQKEALKNTYVEIKALKEASA